MPEPHETIPIKIEQREILNVAKAASVDVAGYLEGYSLFRHESDRPQDRIPAVNQVAERHMMLQDEILTLDAQIERALELEKDFSTVSFPNSDSSSPPDYTFAGVRSKNAKRLLQLLNLSNLDEQILLRASQRTEALKRNGERLKNELFGNDPERVVRATTVGIIEDILCKRANVESSVALPQSSLRSRESLEVHE